MRKVTKKNDRKTWEKIVARRGTKGQPPSSRTASKLGGVRKPSKYHAKPTVSYGIRFDSMKEADRYQELLLLEKAGEIWDLEVQPRFVLSVPSTSGYIRRAAEAIAHPELLRIGEYLADFKYYDRAGTTPYVVEDVKGFRTPLYRWKKKHVEAQYGIVIREL